MILFMAGICYGQVLTLLLVFAWVSFFFAQLTIFQKDRKIAADEKTISIQREHIRVLQGTWNLPHKSQPDGVVVFDDTPKIVIPALEP